MSKFTSFTKKRYYTKDEYKLIGLVAKDKQLYEICAICGAPYGSHRGNDTCEDKAFVLRFHPELEDKLK